MVDREGGSLSILSFEKGERDVDESGGGPDRGKAWEVEENRRRVKSPSILQ